MKLIKQVFGDNHFVKIFYNVFVVHCTSPSSNSSLSDSIVIPCVRKVNGRLRPRDVRARINFQKNMYFASFTAWQKKVAQRG